MLMLMLNVNFICKLDKTKNDKSMNWAISNLYT